jgi:AcrR family transcriptional regulator
MSPEPGIKRQKGRTGRRAGPNLTREAILHASRAAFAERGYDTVSIRAVARAAGVDPALVHRFFGSKESLFVAAMKLPVAPSEFVSALLAGGLDGLGERIVATLLGVYDAPGAFAPFLALLRGAVSNEQAATMLREFVTTEVLGRIAATAAPDQPQLRAALAGSQVIGLAMARYVVRIPETAEASRSQLAACVGPTIQRYLTGPLPKQAHSSQ